MYYIIYIYNPILFLVDTTANIPLLFMRDMTTSTWSDATPPTGENMAALKRKGEGFARGDRKIQNDSERYHVLVTFILSMCMYRYQKCIGKRRQLEGQLSENNTVKGVNN